MISILYTTRLSVALSQANIPFDSVNSDGIVSFLPNATAAQRAQAPVIIAGVDPSPDADALFLVQQAKTQAGTNLDSPDAYGDRLIRALALVVLDEVNVLRSAASLAPRTTTQLINAIKAKL